jgi:hypothetical protein
VIIPNSSQKAIFYTNCGNYTNNNKVYDIIVRHMDPINTPNMNSANHHLRTKEILFSIALVILICIGFLAYSYYKKKMAEEKLNANIQEISDAALKVTLPDEEKSKIIQELSGQSQFKLSPDDAAKREAEINSQLNGK